jgi:acetylornithine deacetylase
MKTYADDISHSVDSLQSSLFSFIQELVQTPSLPGGEQDVQRLVADKLDRINLTVSTLESSYDALKDHPAFCDDGIPFDNRINVVGRWDGDNNESKKAGSLILNGHVDVVSAGNVDLWTDSPWSGKISDGKLYGRGSCDMKAGLACAIFAVEALQKLGLRPERDVLIESVIGEETGGVGSLTTLINGCVADAAIILEPTNLDVCPVQAGALTFRIKVPGRSVHACEKKSGVNAIEKFYLLLEAINEIEWERHSAYQTSAFHSLLYEDPGQVAPINIGTIRGGEWHSTVPNELIVEGRYGVFPGETIGDARWSLARTLRKAASDDPWLRENPPVLEWFEGQFESGHTDIHEPILEVLMNSHTAVVENGPRLRGVTYGSDLRLFTNHAKIPAVLYGPGSPSNAHSVNEFVSLEEVLQCTKVIALTIFEWCGLSL